MQHTRQIKIRALLLVLAVVALTMSSKLMLADTGSCGGATLSLPFSDVPSSNAFFCAIAEAYLTGLTNGTTATTFSPSQNVPRDQMAAFITRTLDQSLIRGSRRAALQQWWTPTSSTLRPVELGGNARRVVCDGSDLWVIVGSQVRRIEASSGRTTEIWTVDEPLRPVTDLIVVGRRIYVLVNAAGGMGRIHVIVDDALVVGNSSLWTEFGGIDPNKMTFDGRYLWTANAGGAALQGSISRVRISVADAPNATFASNFSQPRSILWDGAALWVLDDGDDLLKEVNPSTGQVIIGLPVADQARNMIFDGTNLWITHSGGSITVVRAVGGLRGTVVQTLTGNGLSGCNGLAFDGERVLVANESGNSVSLFKAADFTPLGSQSIGPSTQPSGVCNDGLHFWITRPGSDDIVKF